MSEERGMRRRASAVAVLAASIVWVRLLGAAEPPTIRFTGGSQADLQAVFDSAPEGAVVVCEQTEPLVVAASLTIGKSMTLRGLRANLPEKLGKTPILIVEAKGVTLTDLEMHGNYDTVSQSVRAPIIHIKVGDFRVERCTFYDGSKDGVMVTPEKKAGDIVGGVIRDLKGLRMGRDVVSMSGGNQGRRIRDVTVENVRIERSYERGAVEVSDGTDNIVVRHVYAENALYAVDVQDHSPRTATDMEIKCAPNTNVTIEDVTAVHCTHAIRTANSALGHANLTLRDFRATDCERPVEISNTVHVRYENLVIANNPPATTRRITLRNCDDVELRDVAIEGLEEGVDPVETVQSTNVRVEGLTRKPTASGGDPSQPSS